MQFFIHTFSDWLFQPEDVVVGELFIVNECWQIRCSSFCNMNQMWFILISSACWSINPIVGISSFHFSRQFVHSHDSHVCHICLQLTSFYNNNFSCCICCSKLFALIMHCSSSFPPPPLHRMFFITTSWKWNSSVCLTDCPNVN